MDERFFVGFSEKDSLILIDTFDNGFQPILLKIPIFNDQDDWDIYYDNIKKFVDFLNSKV